MSTFGAGAGLSPVATVVRSGLNWTYTVPANRIAVFFMTEAGTSANPAVQLTVNTINIHDFNLDMKSQAYREMNRGITLDTGDILAKIGGIVQAQGVIIEFNRP